MGTPDLEGTLGTFSFYTDDPEELTRSVPGGHIIKVELRGTRIVLPILGPPNSRRIRDSHPKLRDITVSVLRLFGITASSAMSGRSIY
ncbi:MAG: hypothetical protein ACR2JB_04600 [Bryobacteraceae bacterium]